MPGRGNFSSTVTRVLINSRTAPMGSSMETGEFPESEGYEICISFFFLFSYRMKFRIFLERSLSLRNWRFERKEKKVKSVLTLKRIVTEHIVYKLKKSGRNYRILVFACKGREFI